MLLLWFTSHWLLYYYINLRSCKIFMERFIYIYIEISGAEITLQQLHEVWL